MSNRSAPTHETETSYLARNFDDTRFGWTRMRRTRRRLIVVQAIVFAILVAVTAAAATTDTGRPAWHMVAWLVGLLGFIPLHSALNAGIRGMYDRRSRTLDEHQRRLRDESFIAVRWPATLLTFAAWAGAVGTVGLSGYVRLGLEMGFLIWFVAWLLPYWHLAWTLPDEEAEAA